MSPRVHTVRVELVACETIDLKSREAISETRANRGVLQFLEVLSSQEMYER